MSDPYFDETPESDETLPVLGADKVFHSGTSELQGANAVFSDDHGLSGPDQVFYGNTPFP